MAPSLGYRKRRTCPTEIIELFRYSAYTRLVTYVFEHRRWYHNISRMIHELLASLPKFIPMRWFQVIIQIPVVFGGYRDPLSIGTAEHHINVPTPIPSDFHRKISIFHCSPLTPWPVVKWGISQQWTGTSSRTKTLPSWYQIRWFSTSFSYDDHIKPHSKYQQKNALK